MTSEAVVDPTAPAARPLTLDAIERPAIRAERRLRARRAILWAAKALAAGLVAVAVLLVLRKTGVLGERACRVAIAASAAQVVLVAIVAYARRLPRRAGAVALDRFHGLSDRLSSALSFGELHPGERTPFMLAAIDDALDHARRVDPKRAVPMDRPRELPFLAAMLVAIGVIAVFEIRRHEPVVTAKTIDAIDVTEDDLDAMREFLREIDQRLQTDEAKAATQEFNQLIEDLANKRLDRTEAFRRMQQLEDKLLAGREADAKALEEALKKVGEELKKSELAKPTGEALSNKDLQAAEKGLKDLANKLREAKSKGGVDKQQLDKLREALKKAGEDQAKRAEALAQRREELKQDLLKQRQKADAGANEQEKSLLQKKERELERLDREHEQQQKAQRELDRLDRELQKAAEDLMKDLGLSADDLDGAAEDVNRMARQEMTQEEKEQLRQKLEELRETMRQQAQGGSGRMQRLRVFQQRARGQGQDGKGQGQQQPGQGGQQGEGGQTGQGEGQGGEQAQGQGQGQQGKGQQGQGQGGQGGGETWVLGPNGEKILMLTKGQGGGSNGSSGGKGPGQGPGWGTGHDENVQGKTATNPKVGTQDTQVEGSDTGQGGSRSEVILGAAERGFASKGYTRVYREYHTVAEEALDKDEIPGGYRFYVRRYFQLIRPRDEGGGAAPAP